MQQVSEAVIRSPQGYGFATAQQLIALGYQLDQSLLVSTKTGIQYNLPSYLSADQAVRMVPIIFTGTGGVFADPKDWFYLRSNILSTDTDMKSPLDRLLSDPQYTGLNLTRFPPTIPPNNPLSQILSGISQADQKLPKYIVLPKWCADELSTLELRVASNTKNFTTVLGDKIQLPNGEISRPMQLLNQLVPAGENAQEIQALTQQSSEMAKAEMAKLKPSVDALTKFNDINTMLYNNPNLTEEQKNQIRNVLDQNAQSIKQYQADWTRYSELANFINVKSKTIQPVAGINAQYIGRETCLNLLDLFVKQVPGIVPHVGTFEPVEGFRPFQPTYESTAINPVTISVVLEDSVKSSINKFLEQETCGKSSQIRILNTITSMRKEINENGYDQFIKKYYNVSTCRFAEATGEVKGFVLTKTFPDTQIPLKLGMKKDDIARLLPPTSKDYDNKLLVMFNYIGDEIIKKLKEFKPEEKLDSIPSDILDKIPEGVKPSIKTHVVTTAGFIIPTVPLSEVSIVNLPMVSGNKCLPSLAAKKRQLMK